MAETGSYPQAKSRKTREPERGECADGRRQPLPREKGPKVPGAGGKGSPGKPREGVRRVAAGGAVPTPPDQRGGSSFPVKRVLLFVFAGILTLFALHNALLLSQDILWGDFSARKLHVYPRYKFMRVPATASTLQYDAVHRLAADFAQIYFPAQQPAALKEAYSDETLDPWHRPSRYAPLLHFICSLTLCKLKYGYASLFHMMCQLILFFASLIYAFKVMNLTRYVIISILLIICCLFLTPVGLSWFERGQFSLYVAMSYLWLILGIIKMNTTYVVLSALCAFIKWTSFPYISVILGIYVLSSRNADEIKRSLLVIGVFVLTVILCSLLFLGDTIYFIRGLYSQELFLNPDGISLGRLAPRTMVKLLPVVLIALGYLNARSNGDRLLNNLPLLIGSGIILVTYPTLGCDYSIPCLFGIIPFMIHWVELSQQEDRIIRQVIKYGFIVFIITASFSIRLFQSESALIWWYVFAATIIIVAPYVIDIRYRLRLKV